MRTVGDLHIDLEGYQVIAGGTAVELTRLQRDLLAALTGHVGELVTYEQLAVAGWGHSRDRRVEIRNAMYKLRSTIPRGDRPPAILAVAGHGYILLVPPVSASTSDSAE